MEVTKQNQKAVHKTQVNKKQTLKQEQKLKQHKNQEQQKLKQQKNRIIFQPNANSSKRTGEYNTGNH